MSASFEEYKNQKYFPALDGIRAISILLVITVHLYYKNFSWDWLTGESGVTVFFVLSGYLITMLALREEELSGSLNLKAFYIRRSFRIFPLYFLILGVYCLLIFGLGSGGEYDRSRLSAALPYYLFYVNEYAPGAPFYQSWSLGIEEKFYFVWPFLAFVLFSNKKIPRTIITSFLIVALLLLHNYYPGARLISYYPIALGCLLAIGLHNRDIFNILSHFGTLYFSIAIWTVFIMAQLALKHIPAVWYYYPIIVCLLLLNVIIVEPRWLQWRPITIIGERAYGIYLVHILCLRSVKLVFPAATSNLWVSVCGLITGTLLSYIVAEFLHRMIEKPCVRLGKNFAFNLKKTEFIAKQEGY
jgi:peptidoglycan/LPS O-acetylase OafA/YrhL